MGRHRLTSSGDSMNEDVTTREEVHRVESESSKKRGDFSSCALGGRRNHKDIKRMTVKDRL